MVTTAVGRQAEQRVADLLRGQGYKIRQRNWRVKAAEIDIVAEKHQVIYMVEVKFRATKHQGGGFEYITPVKRRQMEFAARLWTQHHDWTGDYRLLAAAVDGESAAVELLEL